MPSRVLRLDDAQERAAPVAHDAPVATGVELIGREDGGARALGLLGSHQTLDLGRRNERMIRGQHHHRPVGHLLPSREHRGSRALALDLLDDHDVVRKPFGYALARPNHAHHRARAGVAGGVHDPLDHRFTADPVQHLGGAGVHPRAVAGGHDQDREGLGHGARRVAPKHAV